MSKLSEEYKRKMHNLGKPIGEVINELPVKTLLRIGKRVCSTDYEVRFYNYKNHPQFYHNQEALKHAVRRAWTIGAFGHREQILDILEDEGLFKTPDKINVDLGDLVGKDGNAFAILGKCMEAAWSSGWTDRQFSEFCEKATSGDYSKLLDVVSEYFDVTVIKEPIETRMGSDY